MNVLFEILMMLLVGTEQESVNRVSDAEDTRRSSDVNLILNAAMMYSIDNGGDFMEGVGTEKREIGSGEGMADICDDLVPFYLGAMPVDPSLDEVFVDCSDYRTGYNIYLSGERLTIEAPLAEGREVSVMR